MMPQETRIGASLAREREGKDMRAEAAVRGALAQEFLLLHGWAAARRSFLAGDASERRYTRLQRGDQSAVLMDNPPGFADCPAAFARIAAHLRAIGLSPPRIFAQDLDAGFLLLEDLGDALFARVLERAPQHEARLYSGAVDVLVQLQAHCAPTGLPDLTAQEWAEEAALCCDVYALAAQGGEAAPRARADVTDALSAALSRFADGGRVLILRDYHAENLLELPALGRGADIHDLSAARVGLLDFQLAQMGQAGYDLVSLLHDARRDVSAKVQADMLRRFADGTGARMDALRPALAALGAQRALRIIGVFTRLALVAGKTGYLPLIPRVWQHLQSCLDAPELAPLRAQCAAHIPAPSPAILARIKAHAPV